MSEQFGPNAAETESRPIMHRPRTVTIYRDIPPMGAEPADLVVVDGEFAARVPDGAVAEVVDGRRRIAVPTLVDAHIHPDKAAFGEPWYSRRRAATFAERA